MDIGLGLPNGTEANQEMDQGFQEYKPATDASTVRVAAKKMTAHVPVCKKICARMQQKEKGKQSAGAFKGESAVAYLNEYLEEGDPDEVDGQSYF